MKIQLIAKNAPSYKNDSARDRWFKAVIRYEGKSVDSFLKNMGKNPPAVTKSGEAEPPQGWLNYFVREKVIKFA